MQIKGIKTSLFREGDSLIDFIATHIPSIPEGAVLVVTSKIVALAEKRVGSLSDRETIIKKESDIMTPTKWVWLTLKDGMVMANAGVDESNADGKVVLLPKDSYTAARELRRALMKRYGIKKLGVIVSDSRVLPLRAGTMGIALGYAGFKGIKDYRGTKDLFGRPFVFVKANIADSLATAAVLMMGEGAESKPLALIYDVPVSFSETVRRTELSIPLEEDLYLPFFSRLRPSKRKRTGA